jgi:hypothetical protein
MTPRHTLCALLLSATLASSVAPPVSFAAPGTPSHRDTPLGVTTLQAGRSQLRSGDAVGTASRWQEQAQLAASDGLAGDHFGGPVALSGNTALVGAWNADHGAGAAYVFGHTPTGWTQQARLTAADSRASDWFGATVALSGDTALIGAPLAAHSGAAYVFVRNGQQWRQQARLTARDGAPGDWFGRAVALSGESALVGAWYAHDLMGAAYVFTRAASHWSQQAELTPSAGMPGDYFGTTVALSANTALIGAAGSIDNTGSALIFTRNGTTWRQQARLTASDGRPGDTFGGAVALSADTALVGAGFANGNRGAVYVFTLLGQHWQPQARLTAGDGSSGDWFGHALALTGTAALVGAWWANSRAGAVYVFARVAGRWDQQARLTAGKGAGHAYFGSSVANNGSTGLVGAGFQDHARGVVYVLAHLPAR